MLDLGVFRMARLAGEKSINKSRIIPLLRTIKSDEQALELIGILKVGWLTDGISKQKGWEKMKKQLL